MKRLAILVSNAGVGSNLRAIIQAIQRGDLAATVSVVISDSTEAAGIKIAKEHNIPTHIFDSKLERLEDLLTNMYPVEYIVLAGWKKIITDTFIDLFPESILNMHPGLIPDAIIGVVKNPDGTDAMWNRGKLANKAIQNFLDSKSTYAGSTVHFLSHAFDFGKVLGRCFEKIQSQDTVESLYTRLKQKENNLYVKTLKKLCN